MNPPATLRDWAARIHAGFHPAVVDDDIVEELAQHAAAAYAAARADGLDATAALARVDRDIAQWSVDPAAFARRRRRAAAVVAPPTASRPFSGAVQDARYALRLARRQPMYTALVIGTVALAIAATSVLSGVAYGVLLKPLPWPDASRLVQLFETRQGGTGRLRPLMTNSTYLAWSRQSTTAEAFGAWSSSRSSISGNGEPEQIRILGVTASLLPIFQAKPLVGRLFGPDDEVPGHDHVIILSEGLWRQRYGGRPDIVGQAITLDGEPVTVVGVLPASFTPIVRDIVAWQPYRIVEAKDPSTPGTRIQMFGAVARLRPGATPAQAAAEGTARARNVGDLGPVTMAVFGSTGPADVTVKPLIDAMTSEVRPAILVLLAGVALLLAIATANIASLQLARAVGRRRELAIRAAVGGSVRRLVRQALVENLLLGLAGGVCGLLLASWMMHVLPALLPADFPRLIDVGLDVRVKLFTLLLALASGLVFGLLPALDVAGHSLVSALSEDSLAPVGGSLRTRTGAIRAAIMAGQVAAACVLLAGAVLLTRTFVELAHADVGYDRQNVVTAAFQLSAQRYKPERRAAVAEAIARRLSAMPGVIAASYGTSVPFTGSISLSSFPLKRRDGSTVQIQTGARQIGPASVAALGQRVLQGREFTSADTATSQPVVIVNAEFARKYLDNQALGWHLPGPSHAPDREIVGVAADAARQSPTDPPAPEIYFAASQQSLTAGGNVAIVVRASSDPRPLAQALRTAIREEAPDTPIDRIATIDELVATAVTRPRLYAVLLTTFAAFALAIAGVGLFGVLSHSVSQRAREIGIRSALGATGRDIVLLVARQSLVIVGSGIVLGMVVSFWGARLLRTLLYGVTPHDPESFVAVALLLLAVAAVATLVPARRAAHVDPVTVLRA